MHEPVDGARMRGDKRLGMAALVHVARIDTHPDGDMAWDTPRPIWLNRAG